MKPSEVPPIIPFRTKEKDRETIAKLATKRKPKNMSVLIRDGLECLLVKEKDEK
jgi:hypothetical protein